MHSQLSSHRQLIQSKYWRHNSLDFVWDSQVQAPSDRYMKIFSFNSLVKSVKLFHPHRPISNLILVSYEVQTNFIDCYLLGIVFCNNTCLNLIYDLSILHWPWDPWFSTTLCLGRISTNPRLDLFLFSFIDSFALDLERVIFDDISSLTRYCGIATM